MPGLLDLLSQQQNGGGLLGNIPLPRPRPEGAPLPPGFYMPSGPFSQQGYTGGGFNMPGFLSNGHHADMRSEGTDYERARREMLQNPPYSILGSMINPQQASLVDAIRAEILQRQAATGYDPRNLPNMSSSQQ